MKFWLLKSTYGIVNMKYVWTGFSCWVCLLSLPEGQRGEDVAAKQAGILKITSALTAGVSAGCHQYVCNYYAAKLFYFHLFWDVQ